MPPREAFHEDEMAHLDDVRRCMQTVTERLTSMMKMFAAGQMGAACKPHLDGICIMAFWAAILRLAGIVGILEWFLADGASEYKIQWFEGCVSRSMVCNRWRGHDGVR